MGSGTSRGKRVAPACVGQVPADTSPTKAKRPFKPLKIHAILRSARNRAQSDCHSEGPDSDASREDDDVDGEVDTGLTNYEQRGWAAAKKPPIRSAIRARTYGLCHSGQEDEDSGAEEPRGSRVVNKRSSGVSHHFKKQTAVSPSQLNSSSRAFGTRGVSLEAVPTPEKQSTFGSCHNSSVTMPVILYDGSEEELMDTIEKEFS